MTVFLPFLSRRPVHNDSGLHLHGRAPRQRQGGRLRTLLRPGLDLFCPHLSLSDHLPRPAEEERVRRKGGMRVDLGSYYLFEFGKFKSRFQKFEEEKKTTKQLKIVDLQLGKWANDVQLLTRAICLYFEYYTLKWKSCLHNMNN